MQNKQYSIDFDNQIRTIEYISGLIDNAINSGAKGVTLFFGADYMTELSSLNIYLKTIDISVSGAIFPEIIYEGNYYSDGVVIVTWNHPIQVKTFLDISNTDSELYIQPNIHEKPEGTEGCLLFIDAQATSLEDALDALYYRNEHDYKYAGGGAGYLTANNKPCIFSNSGIVADALQTISLPFFQKNKLGHGWSPLSGPHLVTEASGNRLKALDYQPIKKQYRQFIQNNINEDISTTPFEELLLHYPIGIKHYGEEVIVRDPYRYKDGAIEFMGDIPEFSNIYILSGKPQSLLNYVEERIIEEQIIKERTLEQEQSQKKLNTKSHSNNNLSIIFSCVGRRAHMGSISDTELAKISAVLKPTNAIIGTASLGEIVTNQAGLLRLHNMSLVVSRLYP